MNVKEYIESGILELYIAGSLSDKENREVYNIIQKYPEILDEVLNIERSVVRLTSSVAPASPYSFARLKLRLGLNNTDGKTKATQSGTNWLNYTGWAASVLLAGGLIWSLVQKRDLEKQLDVVNQDKLFLEEQIENANADLVEANRLIEILRDRNILNIPLSGQNAAPEAFANIYWDKTNNLVYLDAQGLPDLPEGKVYQLWSLTLSPLTPTDLGVIENFSDDENKIFAIENFNESEAFGITLEPDGGSDSPTLEQLYTLGAVGNTP